MSKTTAPENTRSRKCLQKISFRIPEETLHLEQFLKLENLVSSTPLTLMLDCSVETSTRSFLVTITSPERSRDDVQVEDILLDLGTMLRIFRSTRT